MNIAKVKVYIEYDGSLKELANSLREALGIPEFWFKTDQLPPHDVTAMSECLGFELWLHESDEMKVFILEFESMIVDCNLNKMERRDLSIWFSKYLKTVSNFQIKV